jgi:hypothetical protein
MPPITRASRKHRRHITFGGGSKRRWFPICTAHYSNTLFLLPALSELFQTKKYIPLVMVKQTVLDTKTSTPFQVKQLVLLPKISTPSNGQAVRIPTKNMYLFSRSSG